MIWIWRTAGTSASIREVRKRSYCGDNRPIGQLANSTSWAGHKFFFNPAQHKLAFTLPPLLALCVECEERFATARLQEGAFCKTCMDEWDVPKHFLPIDGGVANVANTEPLNEEVRFVGVRWRCGMEQCGVDKKHPASSSFAMAVCPCGLVGLWHAHGVGASPTVRRM